MTPAALDALLAAGATAEMIAAAWRAEMADVEAAKRGRREADAARKRKERARPECHADIGGHGVTDADIGGPPSLDKESFPQTPFKENNPNPVHIRARKAAGFPAPEGVPDGSWQVFASQRKKRLTQIAYDRILKTLADGKRVGWPPSELIDKAIERGWETVFVPKDERNGRANGQSVSGYGRTIDAALDFVREAEARNAGRVCP